MLVQGGFIGFIGLSETLTWYHQSSNASGVPTAATSVAYRIYGPSGIMTSGTGTMTAHDTGNVTGYSRATHSIASGSGYERGVCYVIRVEDVVSAVTKAHLYFFVVT